MAKAKTVIGLFEDREDADNAISELEDNGFNPNDMSLIMMQTEETTATQDDQGNDYRGDVNKGLETGAVLGGIAGLLIGIGAVTIPGIGAVLIGGPFAAALGLTGIAATTAAGAVTGAVAGGLIGALVNMGLTKREAQHYQERISEGAILLAVPITADQENDVKDLFDENNASDIKTLEANMKEVRQHANV